MRAREVTILGLGCAIATVVVVLASCSAAHAPRADPLPRSDSALIAVIDDPSGPAFWTCALPPLPALVPGAGGPVPVVRESSVFIAGVDTTRETVLGAFDYEHRRIEIRASLVGLAAWQTLAHERVHVALHDASITISDPQLEDRIADAVANQDVNDVLIAAQRAGHCRRRTR